MRESLSLKILGFFCYDNLTKINSVLISKTFVKTLWVCCLKFYILFNLLNYTWLKFLLFCHVI